MRTALLGDQPLLRFSGRGRVWVQSRRPQSTANPVQAFLRVKTKRNDCPSSPARRSVGDHRSAAVLERVGGFDG